MVWLNLKNNFQIEIKLVLKKCKIPPEGVCMLLDFNFKWIQILLNTLILTDSISSS